MRERYAGLPQPAEPQPVKLISTQIREEDLVAWYPFRAELQAQSRMCSRSL
jgi:hypothetical protein